MYALFLLIIFNFAVLTAKEQKALTVIIPSYNNEKWCEKNLRSIYEQDYENYRIMYIDDHSTDNTFEKVNTIITKHNQWHRTTVIQNEIRRGALSNLYHAIHSCPDHEIIVTIDGDDWLARDDAFLIINDAYIENGAWLTYGQFITYPCYEYGMCAPFPEYIISTNAHRHYDWVASHLRTFYAGLFKKIKVNDLYFNDNFYKVAWDYPLMFPMLEMAGHNIKFIPQVLYIYNQVNPLQDGKTHKQEFIEHCGIIARNQKCYEPLKEKPY